MVSFIKSFFSFLEVSLHKPMTYNLRSGSGKSISATVSDSGFELNNLLVHFERKIGPGDLKDGKLLPMSKEEVKRRGGKRSLTLSVSYDAAENLYKVLEAALKDARRRKRRHGMQSLLFSYVIDVDKI